MPRATGGHARTFHEGDHILFAISLYQGPEVAVQMIKGDIDQARHP